MTVSEQIIQVINVLCEKFGIVIDWTDKNIIPYLEILCKNLINYEIATSIVWMAIMILLSIGSIIATKKLTPILKTKIEKQRYDEDWDIVAGFAITGFIILNLVVCGVVMTQIMDIVKCSVIPEMYIFEYFRSLT